MLQVEEFWQFYNHVRKPDTIEANSNYHLFKKVPVRRQSLDCHDSYEVISAFFARISGD